MYGGRLRGQGTYGCVFQPALLCRGSTNPSDDPRKVGKITSLNDARNELQIAKYLQGLPDSSKYTVTAEPQSCIPSSKSKQTDEDINKCEYIGEIPLEKSVQIIMPWGGYPLSRVNLDPKYFNYFKFVEDLLAIGAFLVINDVCHFDLWGQNILFDTHNTPKLIDFGFAFQPSALTSDHLDTRWRQIGFDHDTETPEVTLMLGVEFENIKSPQILARKIEESKPAVQRLVSMCDVIPSQWTSELIRWSEDSQSFQQKDWLSCWKVYWPGFDAWAIGAVLLQVLEIEMTIVGFTQSEQWKLRGEDVKRVLRGLCRGHPAYRIDAAEALSMWTNGAHPLIAESVGGTESVGSESVGSDWVKQKALMRNPHRQ